MSLLASIALDNTSFGFDKEYSYTVPESLKTQVFEGCRVFVPFGRGNAKRQGVILSLFEGNAEGKKEIFSVLDKKSFLSDEMLKMIPFLKNRYFCTYFDALKTVLPKGINYRTDAVYFAVSEKKDSAEELEGDEKSIFLYLLKSATAVNEKALLKSFGLSDNSYLISLLKKGYILKDNRADRNMSDPTEKMLRMNLSEEEYELRKGELTKKQRIVGDLLKDVGAASLKEIIYFCAVTKIVADGLVKKGFASYYDQEILDFEEFDSELSNPQEIELSKAQQNAYNTILEGYRNRNNGCCSLLFGVTGSGKTQVYLKLIDKTLSMSKQVIVMVPEISLTPQTLSIFRSRYGSAVALFHSRLSVGQRMEEWKRVKNGKANIVVGTRSAVFAPCDNLGLIIIDEEQEHTYKSEMSPRYDAKEVARFRCAYNKCLLVLSSATPSVEDYAKAENSTYILAHIPERYGNAVLPEVITVDMRDEKNEDGSQRIISSVLKDELNKNLKNHEQAILLLNRRGFNTFVSCSDCGEVISCPNCSISMTYHRANNRLMCHFCGYSTTLSKTECPNCHSTDIKMRGYGTQRIEEELASAVPGAKILRMDTDTTMTKLSHEKMLDAFSKGEFDILIGTQMVAKGFDFPNVTLAAVVNADQSLYNYDYRCNENTFDLITQVVGRSGRGDKKGRAVIQTCTPDNPILKLAAKQDFVSFFNNEIAIRDLMIYPPFCDLCLVACISSNEASCASAAAFCFNRIKELNKTEFCEQKIMILGPSGAKLTKANNKYRYRLIIKCKNSPGFRAMINKLLLDVNNKKDFKNTTVFADINPVDIM